MANSRFVIHPSREAGVASAIEYFLPNPCLPPDVMDALGPWLGEVVSRDIEGVRALLRDRWASINSKALLRLKEQLLGYDPASIFVRETTSWLRLTMPNADLTEVGTSAYLLPPVRLDARARHILRNHGIAPDSAFGEFVVQFNGLAEDLRNTYGGQFIHLAREWETFSEDWQQVIGGFEEWKGSLLVYHAINSDQVLLRQDGAIGWWAYAEKIVRPQNKDFEEFLEYYVDYKKTGWPLDSYGPPGDS